MPDAKEAAAAPAVSPTLKDDESAAERKLQAKRKNEAPRAVSGERAATTNGNDDGEHVARSCEEGGGHRPVCAAKR
jgi:hypothetical protein